jgi:hypothetical protein
MAMRNWRATSLTLRSPTSKPSHLRRSPCFIDENKTFGIKLGLSIEPSLTGSPYIGPILFGSVRRLFL